MTFLLGIAGRKRSGKNTAGDVFVAGGYQELAFATPIKLMLATLLKYRGADKATIQRMLEGDLKEEPTKLLGGKSPRFAMRALGDVFGRQEMGADFWVEALFDASKPFKRVVVTDVRRPNEAGAIQACGGQVLRVSRPNNPLPPDDHPSEAQVDTLNVDHEITNDAASAEEFQRVVALMFFDGVAGSA